ncbi:MAG: NADH-quinone oxidoreductase subunit N [Flammeovirgaceae bacterium]|nr:NADH-quinone oxidoreductase subunit N [Flammeovirgaceae bacterium]
MNKLEFINLLPGILLAGASVLVMLVIAFKRNHKLAYMISGFSLLGVFYYLLAYAATKTFSVEPLFIVDGFGTFNTILIVISTLAIVMLSYPYFEQREERKEEYYILLLLATLGAAMLVISKHFVSLFLGLEILSVALYSMIAYLRKRERSDEAGIKYLILAAFSSAFLLFGMALVYSETGSMDFSGIAETIKSKESLSLILLAGFGLMIVGVGFKLGVVPFHMWTPDVYEGAPAPVTAFIATVSKGGMIALLVRFFTQVDGYHYPTLVLIFVVIAITSMFVGNLLALRQNNVKRILAYSSIAHLGYILVAFLAGNESGVEAISFYLTAYFITSIGAFGIITILSDTDRDAERMEDYQGLFWRRPFMAAALTAMLLSLAGIPLTAGFVGKFYLLASGVSTGLWLLVVALAVNSVIGLYYYIKIIAVMFEQPKVEEADKLNPTMYVVSVSTVSILTLLLVWFGIQPQAMIVWIKSLLAGSIMN